MKTVAASFRLGDPAGIFLVGGSPGINIGQHHAEFSGQMRETEDGIGFKKFISRFNPYGNFFWIPWFDTTHPDKNLGKNQ